MDSFFNNPWVVGIGGGILSGVVVTLLSRYFFSKRDKKEYLANVFQADKEVIYAIKQPISEGLLPTAEVIFSLNTSTAKKYNIDIKDMKSLDQIADDLVKEVMDSSFISAKTKAEHCDLIGQLKNEFFKNTQKGANVHDLGIAPSIAIPRNSNKISFEIQSVSLLLGILTTFMTIYTFVLRSDVMRIKWLATDSANLVISIVLPMIAIILSKSITDIMKLKSRGKLITNEEQYNNKNKEEKDA